MPTSQDERDLLHKRYSALADSVGTQLRMGSPFILAPTWWLRIILRGKEREIVANIEQTNPGFGSFYKAWKANDNSQAWLIIGQSAADGVLDYLTDDLQTRGVVREELKRHGR